MAKRRSSRLERRRKRSLPQHVCWGQASRGRHVLRFHSFHLACCPRRAQIGTWFLGDLMFHCSRPVLPSSFLRLACCPRRAQIGHLAPRWPDVPLQSASSPSFTFLCMRTLTSRTATITPCSVAATSTWTRAFQHLGTYLLPPQFVKFPRLRPLIVWLGHLCTTLYRGAVCIPSPCASPTCSWCQGWAGGHQKFFMTDSFLRGVTALKPPWGRRKRSLPQHVCWGQASPGRHVLSLQLFHVACCPRRAQIGTSPRWLDVPLQSATSPSLSFLCMRTLTFRTATLTPCSVAATSIWTRAFQHLGISVSWRSSLNFRG